MDCRIGGITFSSNFDSGNLAHVEKVLHDADERSSSSVASNIRQQHAQKTNNGANNNIFGNISIADIRVDYEFKLWTSPDCAGTTYENGNRTWFYFSVRGYSPGKVIRLTIMNMNKQSKIYGQGYAPLYRVYNSVVARSRWQRIRDKPLWEIVNGQFLLTFIHRFLDPRGSVTYFAFCYPWTYNEMQMQLNKLDSIFHYGTSHLDKDLFPYKRNENDENVSRLVKSNEIDDDAVHDINEDLHGFMTSSTTNTVTTTVAAACDGDGGSPSSASSSSSSSPSTLLQGYKTYFREIELFDKIYFHRELLCYSLEGRRIDLLTISDWSGCTNIEEDRFDPLLFPDATIRRSWKFTNKKVVLVSARVHPGETPSSHVFNGLLEFLLRLNDQRACELRKNYIFKLIPMLNPDGVFHGHYRTDTRGVNLNRVYLKPDFLYYPSIYATKALITYYHTNYGTVKLYAPFLDNIFRRQILTDSPKPSAASVAPPPDNLPTTESTTDIENPQDFVDQNTLDTSFSFSEISKLSNDKSFDYNVQEQINSENQSADEPNITTEGESTDKLLSYLDSNHSIKSDELFTSNRSTFVQEVTNNLFLPEPTSTQPMTPQITVPNQKENNPYLDSLENVEQLISNSSQSLINERVPVVHRINYSVDSFDDKNNVTETIDTGIVSNTCQGIKISHNSSVKRLLKTNKARSTSTSSYVADLNKDFSDISKNHLNSYRIPSIFNKEVASRQIVSTAAPSPGAKPSSSTTPASTMSNLTPTVRRLITSTPSNIIIKRSSGQDKKSKKSYNEYRNSGLKSSVHSQPNRIPPLFNRSKHCPTLKVDCLPCFLMEWNMPYQQAVTTGRVSKSLVEKAEPVNSSIKLNAAQILNFDSEIDDSQKNLKSLDSEKSLLQYTSPLESDQSDEKKLFFLNDDYQILHHSQMMPFYDAVSALVTSDAQECKHKHNGDEENNSDQYNENKQRNHLSPDNEANISSETAIQLVNEDLYCFESSCSVIGNEGSDMDEDENNEQSNQEDLSINPQYVEILKSVETMVREEKNKTTLIDEGSMNTSVDDLNVDELKRMEMLKEQLDQLRKAHHLSDANELQLEESNVAFYFDLHGHCSKRGCFLYGNWLETEDSMVDNVLYALLVGVNSIYFDFDSCNFSLRNMYLKDRKGSYTKEGAGRVAISKHLGLTHCYTVECNYNAGPLPNRLSRFVTSALPNDSGRLTPVGTFYGPHWSDIASSGSIQSCHSGISVQLNTIHNVYTNTLNQTSSGAPRFTPAHYEDVGRALMIAILDINQINPWPKIASLGGPNSEPDIGILTLSSSLPEFSSIKTLKEWTRTYVRGIASLNASIKASTNRLTEVPTTKLSDSKKQVNKKLPLNSEPSEGVASFSSTGNVATQNPVKSRENSVKRNISNAVTNSSISKKFLMQTNITSQATNDFLSSTATVLDKTFSSTTNTPSRSDRKNHLYHSNPTPSHTSIRSKLQYYHESSDFTKVHSPLYSRLTPMATEDTGATPTTIPINHCEELKSQTLYNNDNLLKCNRRKNGKSFLYDDGNGENLIKVMNKNLNCQLIRRKVADASKEYQTKCKSYMLKKKLSLDINKNFTQCCNTVKESINETLDNNSSNRTELLDSKYSSHLSVEYTNSIYETDDTVNSNPSHMLYNQLITLPTNNSPQTTEIYDRNMITDIHKKSVNNKHSHSFGKIKRAINEYKSAKGHSNEKMKHSYVRKGSRNELHKGFSYTRPGYTKLLKHYTSLHCSDNKNNNMKSFIVYTNKTPKSKNNKSCHVNNSLHYWKSRSFKLKSLTKTILYENKSPPENADICTIFTTDMSDQNNYSEYNNNNNTGIEVIFDNNISIVYSRNTNSTTGTSEKTIHFPLINRSHSLKNIITPSESDDCINELKALFKSMSLN